MAIYCDFCNKHQLKAEFIIDSPINRKIGYTTHICDDCVRKSMQLIIDKREEMEKSNEIHPS
jgi:hypothetical protein